MLLLSQLYHSHLVATNLLNLPNLLLKQKATVVEEAPVVEEDAAATDSVAVEVTDSVAVEAAPAE